MQSLVTPAISAIPVNGRRRGSIPAPLGVQLVAQHGLIDDAGGLGLVVQRLGVDRHQRAVGAGLPVGHDDMGVQVRVPAARRFMLIGDRRPAQAAAAGPSSPVTGLCTRVYPACCVQVGHRRVDRPLMGAGHRFFADVVGQAPAAATHSWARRRSDRTRAHCLGERPPGRPVGGDPVIEPARPPRRCQPNPPSTARPSRPVSSHGGRHRRRPARSAPGYRLRSSTHPAPRWRAWRSIAGLPAWSAVSL